MEAEGSKRGRLSAKQKDERMYVRAHTYSVLFLDWDFSLFQRNNQSLISACLQNKHLQ